MLSYGLTDSLLTLLTYICASAGSQLLSQGKSGFIMWNTNRDMRIAFTISTCLLMICSINRSDVADV